MSVLSEKETNEINRQIDHALSFGTEAGITWLRCAFHTHKEQIEYLRKQLRELRGLFIKKFTQVQSLSVAEARMLKVCRICCQPDDQKLPLVFNFGG